MLQVTLEDLWRSGSLRLEHYDGLAHAIQRRADAVYAYRDFDGLQQDSHSSEEQTTILTLLLDLVRITPGEE